MLHSNSTCGRITLRRHHLQTHWFQRLLCSTCSINFTHSFHRFLRRARTSELHRSIWHSRWRRMLGWAPIPVASRHFDAMRTELLGTGREAYQWAQALAHGVTFHPVVHSLHCPLACTMSGACGYGGDSRGFSSRAFARRMCSTQPWPCCVCCLSFSRLTNVLWF